MTAPINRPSGRPRRVVPDPAYADRVLSELCQADEQLRQVAVRRVQLALAASEAGLTAVRIGEAVGVTSATVGNWIRIARSLQDDDPSERVNS